MQGIERQARGGRRGGHRIASEPSQRQMLANLVQQHRRMHWLGQVVTAIGSDARTVDEGIGRNDDDRRRRTHRAANQPGGLPAVELRHGEVHQDQVRVV